MRSLILSTMLVFIIFAVILLLLAAYTAHEKEWFSTVVYVLMSAFFVWIYFLSRV